MQHSVLMVEDERKIRDLLRSYLEHEGLAVLTTWSGAEAINLVRDTTPDLVVLDLGLPDVNGQDVVREVRSFAATPILILTARDDTRERINCLELGAVDYVTKPFSPREVALRVRAILRRLQPAPPSARSRHTETVNSSSTDPECRQPSAGSQWSSPRPNGKLISTMAAAPGRVYSRYELINRIRGYDSDGYERIVDSHVRNLRHKVDEADRRHPRLVQTVFGTGYRFGLKRDKPPRPTVRTG